MNPAFLIVTKCPQVKGYVSIARFKTFSLRDFCLKFYKREAREAGQSIPLMARDPEDRERQDGRRTF